MADYVNNVVSLTGIVFVSLQLFFCLTVHYLLSWSTVVQCPVALHGCPVGLSSDC